MTRELHPDRDLDSSPEAPTSARQRTTRVLAVAGCLAAIVVLYLVAVRTQVGQRMDDASIVRHHLDRTPSKDVRRLEPDALAGDHRARPARRVVRASAASAGSS